MCKNEDFSSKKRKKLQKLHSFSEFINPFVRYCRVKIIFFRLQYCIKKIVLYL